MIATNRTFLFSQTRTQFAAVSNSAFVGESPATRDVLVAVAVVQPGKAVHRAHRHPEEEYLILVEGSGTWSLNGKETPAQRR